METIERKLEQSETGGAVISADFIWKANATSRMDRMESYAELHIENHGERIHKLEETVRNLNNDLTVTFIGMVIAVMVAVIALGMAQDLQGHVSELQRMTADTFARVTRLVAEFRGIGG